MMLSVYSSSVAEVTLGARSGSSVASSVEPLFSFSGLTSFSPLPFSCLCSTALESSTSGFVDSLELNEGRFSKFHFKKKFCLLRLCFLLLLLLVLLFSVHGKSHGKPIRGWRGRNRFTGASTSPGEKCPVETKNSGSGTLSFRGC